MKRKACIFAVLSTFLLSLCLLGCQHGTAPSSEAVEWDHRGREYMYMRGDKWQAIEAYTKALECSPQYAEAYRHRGAVYHLLGKDYYEQAIADYTAALRIDPQDAEAYHGRGSVYRSLGKDHYEQAIADYTAALRIHPQDADTYCDRGELYREQHQPEQAIADYTAALQNNPENKMVVYCDRGRSYNENAQTEQALADFTAALQIDPQQPGIWYAKGEIYEKLGRKTEAIEAYREVLRHPAKPADHGITEINAEMKISWLTAHKFPGQW